MLINLLKLMIFIVVLKLLLPFLRGVAGAISHFLSPAKKSTRDDSSNENQYSDLTSYEIEDADFEEIKEEQPD